MEKILGMGNALTDVLVQLDNESHLENLGLPKGSMQLVDVATNSKVQDYIGNMPKQMIAGGSASNTMRGIACLGGDATFVGMVGKDEVGKGHRYPAPAAIVYRTTPGHLRAAQSNFAANCCRYQIHTY